MSSKSFAALGLSPALVRATARAGYRSATPIQVRAIPALLSGRDLIGIAQTGTGKTAAFVLPMLQRLAGGVAVRGQARPRGLVLAPTRELAVQIDEEMRGFAAELGLRQVLVFGGVAPGPQIRALGEGVDIVIATPGRLLDLLDRRELDLGEVAVLVLDEADRLLDPGFLEAVQRIVRDIPVDRQSMLFTATMAPGIGALAERLLRRPVRVDVTPRNMTIDRIRQRVIVVETREKFWVLEHLLRESPRASSIVFCRTRGDVERIRADLMRVGVAASALHGDLSQRERLLTLEDFRLGKARVLVATDVAARGLDIPEVTQVINYQIPRDPESYVHRIGRTGRAGAAGMAWSLCDPGEVPWLRAIERFIRRAIPTEAEAALDGSGEPGRNRRGKQPAPRTGRRNPKSGSRSRS